MKVDAGVDRDTRPARGTGPQQALRLWVNWALALLTVVGAGVVMAVALGAVMSTAACSDKAMPEPGPERDQLRHAVLRRSGGGGG